MVWAGPACRGPIVPHDLPAARTSATLEFVRLSDNQTIDGGVGHESAARVGTSLRHGRADPLPHRLPDQPLHGPGRAARPGPGPDPVARARGHDRAARRERRGARAARRCSGHGLRDEPRPRAGPRGYRRLRPGPRRALAHAPPPTPDGDSFGAGVVRGARLHHVVRRSRRGRRAPRGRRRLRLRRRPRRGLRPAYRGAGAQASRHRPGHPGARSADHPPGHVPPRPCVLSARRTARASCVPPPSTTPARRL